MNVNTASLLMTLLELGCLDTIKFYENSNKLSHKSMVPEGWLHCVLRWVTGYLLKLHWMFRVSF